MFGDLVDDVDRGAITGDYAEFVADQMREGQRESSAGWLDDDIAFTQPWGFDLGSITGQVHVWQGAHDRMVPFAHGAVAGRAPPGQPCAHLHPEHGHMSLAVDGFRGSSTRSSTAPDPTAPDHSRLVLSARFTMACRA